MKTGELYNLRGKTYMILEIFERSFVDWCNDARDPLERRVAHVACMGPNELEEFPLEWFCQNAETVDEAR